MAALANEKRAIYVDAPVSGGDFFVFNDSRFVESFKLEQKRCKIIQTLDVIFSIFAKISVLINRKKRSFTFVFSDAKNGNHNFSCSINEIFFETIRQNYEFILEKRI